MALKLDYVDSQYHTTFKDAYVRIVSGGFDQRFISINVGVYASKDARETEKNKQALAIAYSDSLDAVAIAQNELEKSEEELGLLHSKLINSGLSFEAGKTKQEELDKDTKAFESAKEGVKKLQDNYQKALEDHRNIGAQLDKLPESRYLDTKYFTFHRKDNEKIDFSDLYDLLKKTDEFKGAIDT